MAEKTIHAAHDADPTRLSNTALAHELAVLSMRGEQTSGPTEETTMLNGAIAAYEYALDVGGQRPPSIGRNPDDLIQPDALVAELARRLTKMGEEQ